MATCISQLLYADWCGVCCGAHTPCRPARSGTASESGIFWCLGLLTPALADRTVCLSCMPTRVYTLDDLFSFTSPPCQSVMSMSSSALSSHIAFVRETGTTEGAAEADNTVNCCCWTIRDGADEADNIVAGCVEECVEEEVTEEVFRANTESWRCP